MTYFSLSQEEYIEELCKRYDLTFSNSVVKPPSVDTIDLSPGEGEEVDQSLPVRNIIGALLYIANMTRPDIAAAVSYLSRYLNKPTKKLFKYCKLLLKYISTTRDKKLFLGKLDDTSLVAFADANYAPNGDRKSQSGGLIKLAGSSIVWLSKKQKTVSQSTTEAEYIALASVCNKVLWVQKMMSELNIHVIFPTKVYEDNKSTIAVVKNQKSSEVAKHIDIKVHALDDYVAKGQIDVEYIETDNQLADGLTKVKGCTRDITSLLGSPMEQEVQKQGEC